MKSDKNSTWEKVQHVFKVCYYLTIDDSEHFGIEEIEGRQNGLKVIYILLMALHSFQLVYKDTHLWKNNLTNPSGIEHITPVNTTNTFPLWLCNSYNYRFILLLNSRRKNPRKLKHQRFSSFYFWVMLCVCALVSFHLK